MGMLKGEREHPSYQTASGPIPYNLMNDYMFRVVLQENELVLRGLIGSLLNLDQSEIKSAVITNPIKLGEQIDDKTFVLDIHVLLNDDTYMNLEMQIRRSGKSVGRVKSITAISVGYRNSLKRKTRLLPRESK